MMGIQNVAAIFCVPLIPYCWDTKYGNHILYPLKDQRGIQNMAGTQNMALAGCKTLVSFGLLPVPLHFCSPADTVPLKGGPVRMGFDSCL